MGRRFAPGLGDGRWEMGDGRWEMGDGDGRWEMEMGEWNATPTLRYAVGGDGLAGAEASSVGDSNEAEGGIDHLIVGGAGRRSR